MRWCLTALQTVQTERPNCHTEHMKTMNIKRKKSKVLFFGVIEKTGCDRSVIKKYLLKKYTEGLRQKFSILRIYFYSNLHLSKNLVLS